MEPNTTNPSLLGGAALVSAFAVGLGWSVRWLIGLGRLLRSTRPASTPASVGAAAGDGQSGTAVVEFALIFPIALTALLLVIQAALMMQADIVVNYAAGAAARSAVVWIPRNMISGPAPADPLTRSDASNSISSDSVLSPKFFRIQSAAALACWPISGQFSPDFTQSAAGALPQAAWATAGALQLMRQVPGSQHTFDRYTDEDWLSKYLYSVMNTRVRVQRVAPVLPWRPPGNYGADDLVQVDVEHDFALRIPFAGRMLGRRKTSVGMLNLSLGDKDRIYTTTIRATATLSNEGRTEYPPGVVGR